MNHRNLDKPRDPNFTQEVQASHISAHACAGKGGPRRGSSNGLFTLQGAQEFALDFVQRIVKPFQVVARVILPPTVVPRFHHGPQPIISRTMQPRSGPAAGPGDSAGPGAAAVGGRHLVRK